MKTSRLIALLLLAGACSAGVGTPTSPAQRIYMEQGTFVPDQHTLTAQFAQQVEFVPLVSSVPDTAIHIGLLRPGRHPFKWSSVAAARIGARFLTVADAHTADEGTYTNCVGRSYAVHCRSGNVSSTTVTYDLWR
ncbi:MAG: hypothetical protein RL033_1823 [Pseudomonadota bacterium]|jgi:hypothetical protein